MNPPGTPSKEGEGTGQGYLGGFFSYMPSMPSVPAMPTFGLWGSSTTSSSTATATTPQKQPAVPRPPSKPAQEPEETRVRDKTRFFADKRGDCKARVARELKYIRDRRKRVATERKVKEQQRLEKEKAAKQQGYTSFLDPSTYTSYLDPSAWLGSEKIVVPPEDKAAKSADRCYICANSFNRLLAKKYYCPLCEQFLCGSCLSQQVSIDDEDAAVKIWGCTACAKLVQRLEEHEMFQHAIATASKNNFVWFHNRISSQFQLLSILVPRYTDMVMNNPTVERLEAAGEIEKDVADVLKGFEIDVKKLATLPLDNPKDESIRTRIKLLCATFLQENKAYFRVLNEQRKAALIEAEEREKKEAEEKLRREKEAKENPGKSVPPASSSTYLPTLSGVSLASMTVPGWTYGRSLMQSTMAGVGLAGQATTPTTTPVKQGLAVSEVKAKRSSGNYTTDTGAPKDREDETMKRSQSVDEIHSMKDKDSEKEKREEAGEGEEDHKWKVKARALLAEDTPQSASPAGPPTIKLIEPSTSPLRGTKARLTGTNLCDGSVVVMGDKKIEGVKCVDGREADTQVLIFQTPELRDGFHNVKVVNPDGLSCEVRDMIFYSKKL